MNATPSTQVPRPGMFATVRNRRGIVSAVEPFDGQNGWLHLHANNLLGEAGYCQLLADIEAGQTCVKPQQISEPPMSYGNTKDKQGSLFD